MSNSDTSNNDYGSNVPMRWAANRIASASILILLLLGGLAYGIYSIVNNSTVSAPTTAHSTQATPPVRTRPTKQSASSGHQSATNSPSPTQLTNTGPGETALIGFIGAAVLGTALHYVGRKFARRRGITTVV